MAQSISIYRSLVDITAERFHDVKFTGNIYKLDKDWKEDKKYSSKDTIDLNQAWLELYDEYFEKTDDTRFTKDLKNKEKNITLLLQIKVIEEIIDVLRFIDKDKEFMPAETYLETVSSIGNNLKRVNNKIKFEVTKPIKDQLPQFEAVLGGLQTRYEILFKEDLSIEPKDLQLYYDIITEIELTLDKNMPRYMNMLHYIAYEKQYRKKIRMLNLRASRNK